MADAAPIKKLLVANRGEIAIRIFRSATELGLRTVAVYTHEDRFALHRFKADEAYQVGKPGEPLAAYLDVPNLVALCVREGVDAVHPGYGFLSENAKFAEQLEAAGVRFVGPRTDVLKRLGDKVSARAIAKAAGVPVLEGTDSVTDVAEAKTLADAAGYPVMLKAAHGGGGRGMRIVRTEAELADAFEGAQRESQTAFGSGEIFLERFIEKARHLEVQLLGDDHGGLVHLRERDCSVQRRHQKVVEIAPAPNLPDDVRAGVLDAAVRIGKEVNYRSAGTVEFLYDAERAEFFFIEVNPRIQVEHTVTEEVTGVDVVKSQILIAGGTALGDDAIGLPSQDAVRADGFAVQARVTTEDPAAGFTPDYGRIAHYRSSGGPGVRLDAGNAFSGAVVQPFYDSLLVKVTAHGRRFEDAIVKLHRTLMEFRIRGVKTNIPFLLKVLDHPTFRAGEATTRFIDSTPELFKFPERKNRATKLLKYLGETIVNGNDLVKDRPPALRREPAPVPGFDAAGDRPKGTRDTFKDLGPEKFAEWVRQQDRLLITDTTFRDAHQSLLATRVRTRDMLNVAGAYSRRLDGLFSLEMWGGATFDVSMRFLKESPLAAARRAAGGLPEHPVPDVAAGVERGRLYELPGQRRPHVREGDGGRRAGPVSGCFDALNWTKNMKVAMEAVRETGALCEACLCYTGDLLDPSRTKYDLKYYVQLAKELESLGANILAIKDMAGLCKPEAARLLVKALRDETDLPIHYHTHDTAGIQAAGILNAADVGLDIADAAMAPLSGGTAPGEPQHAR